MSIWNAATDELADRMSSSDDTIPAPPSAAMARATDDDGEATVEIGGQDVPVAPPETVKTDEDGTWLTGDGIYGRPRGRDALQARQMVQCSAMQAIANGIVDQLLGGDLAFESDDDETDAAEAEIQALIREVLTGPHLAGHDLDDLITAAVEDMLGPGNAYWQFHPPAEGSGVDLPVVALSTLDPLTIRHAITRHGLWQDPPIWQAPQSAFAGEGIAQLGTIEPASLDLSEIAIMHYPRGARSYKFYPVSPSLQVRDWLEILTNSTTHHNRFYSDNQIPPGVISVLDSQGGVSAIKDQLEAASGDPRDVPIVEGSAQWMELGGTAVNLNLIEEQRWFFQLCLASLGLGKQELGFIEDVNRSNGEVEASRIYKRISGPFGKQFQGAFEHVAAQFDVYNALDDPFSIVLRQTDPREEHEREKRLRDMYNDGALTLRQYVRRRGDEDLADNEMTVEINGTTVDYGDYPKHVVEALLRDARSDPDADADMGDDEDSDEDDESEAML